VVYIVNRVTSERKYHDQIERILEILDTGEMPYGELVEMPGHNMLRLIRQGLDSGWYNEADKISQWVGATNLAGMFAYTSGRLQPLELLVVHADSHMHEVELKICAGGQRPAGVILSGSSKMIDRVRTTPVVQSELRLIRYLLDQQIPCFGICFGFHLLVLARFGIQARYLHVPRTGKYLVELRPGRNRIFHPMRAGKRLMVFGRSQVRRVRHDHPVMHYMREALVLQAHSMYVSADLTPSIAPFVLAEGLLRFAPSRYIRHGAEQVRQIVEVIEAGPWSVGTQFHPELSPELLYVLSFFRGVRRMLLEQRQPIEEIRERLLTFNRTTYFAGERVGYNFVKRVLAVNYILRNLESGSITLAEARAQLRGLRIKEDDPRVAHLFAA